MAVACTAPSSSFRLDPAGGERVLEEPNVRRFDTTGRPIKGWILVAPDGLETDSGLERWVDVRVAFAGRRRPQA